MILNTFSRGIVKGSVLAIAVGVTLLFAGTPEASAQKSKPPAPNGLVSVSSAIREVSLSWNAVAGAKSYRIYRGLTTNRKLPLVGTRTVPNFVNSGLASNTVYQYAVTAVNASGESSAAYVKGLAVSGLPTGADPAISFARSGTAGGAFVMDANGGNITRVGLASGEWSPDGMKLLYSLFGALWICNRDGTGGIRLVQPPAGDAVYYAWSPAPTPDGKYKIAYCTSGEVWVVNPDGTGNRQLTFLTSSGAWHEAVSWSPDATRLAVSTYYELSVEPYNIGTIQVLGLGFDGIGIYEASRSTAFEDLTGNWFIQHVDWCRTGDPANGKPDFIAFSADISAPTTIRHEIYILDIAEPASIRRLLPSWTTRHYDPRWSPDDTQLLFDSASTIYKVGADGSNPTAVTAGFDARWRRNP